MKKLSAGAIISNFIFISYILYDLTYPDHFVGDMYGMEIMFRAGILLAVIFVLVIGFLLMSMGWNRNNRRMSMTGAVVSVICSLILASIAVTIYFSREKDEIRKTYAHKSTGELVRIALKEKDMYALHPIIERKDRSAVPALGDMLLDGNQDMALRMTAATALGQIGGDEARIALEKAIGSSNHPYLADAIRYAREAAIRNETKEER